MTLRGREALWNDPYPREGEREALIQRYFTPRKTLRDEFAMAALSGLLAVGRSSEIDMVYRYADLALLARDAQEEETPEA